MHELFLYVRDDCHLCDEARQHIRDVVADRAAAGHPVPTIIERDIDTDPTWQRAFMATIPVVELAGRRLELALSRRKIERLISDAMDGATAASSATTASS